MKQYLICVVVLLATLSIVNAIPLHKRDIFTTCTAGLPFNSLTFNPDPPVPGSICIVTVTGKATEILNMGVVYNVTFYNSVYNLMDAPVVFDYCAASGGCPTANGANFNSVLKLPIPADIPPSPSQAVPYYITVTLIDPNSNYNVVGCLNAQIDGVPGAESGPGTGAATTGTPPGVPNTPAAAGNTPPGPNAPPATPNTPPAAAGNTPPGPNAPPATPNTPPAAAGNTPPGPNAPPATPNTPPGPNAPPATPNTPPAAAGNTPPGPNAPPATPNTPPGPNTPPAAAAGGNPAPPYPPP